MFETTKGNLETKKTELEKLLVDLQGNIEFMKDHIHEGAYETEDIIKMQSWLDETEEELCEVEKMLGDWVLLGGEYDA